MKAKTITVYEVCCNLCGHQWDAKTEHPRLCANPRCKSPRWNDPAGRLRPPIAVQRANAAQRRRGQVTQ
jgi:predicted Zn-ribbon and HTH transcriptional regulator